VNPKKDKLEPSKLDGIIKNLNIKIAKPNIPGSQITLIEINSIRTLVRHPFMHFHKSIEVTTKSGQSYCVAFNGEKERERVFSLLQSNSSNFLNDQATRSE
jgi:hypothetical protein